jgi:hypothetical protein
MENDTQKLSPQPVPQLPAPKKWYKHTGIIWIIALAVMAGLAIWLYYAKQLTQNSTVNGASQVTNKNQSTSSSNSTVSNQVANSQPAIPVPSGWKTYSQDVLGVSFGYPTEWGDPSTEPSQYITDLKTVDQGYQQPDNGFNNNLELHFANTGLRVQFFNDQYRGVTDSGEVSSGYLDSNNASTLQQTKNICNYTINFQDSSGESSLREIYSDCTNGIKISLLEETQHFNPASFPNDPSMPASGILYTYNLNYYGYKTLQNNYFDNLYVSYIATSTRQLSSPLTAEQFFTQTGINTSSDPTLAKFTTFIQTIKSYRPPAQPTPTFTTTEGEDPNITLIRQYYYDLVDGQASNAYQLLKNPATSSTAFIAQSQNIYQATPRDFTKLGNGSYEYWVDYQEQNSQPVQERVVVEIVDGKIKQDLLDTLTSLIATSGNMTAYAADRAKNSIVLLRQNNNDTIIDSAINDPKGDLVGNTIFSSVSFSPMGKYIVYVAGGWEASSMKVYDIKNQKQALETSGGTGQFNPSETLYFFCDRNDEDGDYEATVYNVPGFTVKLELLKQFPELNNFDDVTCSEDQQNNLIHFTFTGEMDKNGNDNSNITKTYNVSLQTGELSN